MFTIKAIVLQTFSYECYLGKNNGKIDFFTFLMIQSFRALPYWIQPGMAHCHVSVLLCRLIPSYHTYSSFAKDKYSKFLIITVSPVVTELTLFGVQFQIDTGEKNNSFYLIFTL